jgi:hypothetical protein
MSEENKVGETYLYSGNVLHLYDRPLYLLPNQGYTQLRVTIEQVPAKHYSSAELLSRNSADDIKAFKSAWHGPPKGPNEARRALKYIMPWFLQARALWVKVVATEPTAFITRAICDGDGGEDQMHLADDAAHFITESYVLPNDIVKFYTFHELNDDISQFYIGQALVQYVDTDTTLKLQTKITDDNGVEHDYTEAYCYYILSIDTKYKPAPISIRRGWTPASEPKPRKDLYSQFYVDEMCRSDWGPDGAWGDIGRSSQSEFQDDHNNDQWYATRAFIPSCIIYRDTLDPEGLLPIATLIPKPDEAKVRHSGVLHPPADLVAYGYGPRRGTGEDTDSYGAGLRTDAPDMFPTEMLYCRAAHITQRHHDANGFPLPVQEQSGIDFWEGTRNGVDYDVIVDHMCKMVATVRTNSIASPIRLAFNVEQKELDTPADLGVITLAAKYYDYMPCGPVSRAGCVFTREVFHWDDRHVNVYYPAHGFQNYQLVWVTGTNGYYDGLRMVSERSVDNFTLADTEYSLIGGNQVGTCEDFGQHFNKTDSAIDHVSTITNRGQRINRQMDGIYNPGDAMFGGVPGAIGIGRGAYSGTPGTGIIDLCLWGQATLLTPLEDTRWSDPDNARYMGAPCQWLSRRSIRASQKIWTGVPDVPGWAYEEADLLTATFSERTLAQQMGFHCAAMKREDAYAVFDTWNYRFSGIRDIMLWSVRKETPDIGTIPNWTWFATTWWEYGMGILPSPLYLPAPERLKAVVESRASSEFIIGLPRIKVTVETSVVSPEGPTVTSRKCYYTDIPYTWHKQSSFSEVNQFLQWCTYRAPWLTIFVDNYGHTYTASGQDCADTFGYGTYSAGTLGFEIMLSTAGVAIRPTGGTFAPLREGREVYTLDETDAPFEYDADYYLTKTWRAFVDACEAAGLLYEGNNIPDAEPSFGGT